MFNYSTVLQDSWLYYVLSCIKYIAEICYFSLSIIIKVLQIHCIVRPRKKKRQVSQTKVNQM